MKFLKKFETETARKNFPVNNDMIVYVEETDNVYTDTLYKMVSYTWHNSEEYPDSEVGLYACDNSLQVSGASTIDKIVFNGETIDMNDLTIGFPYNSDFGHAVYKPQLEPVHYDIWEGVEHIENLEDEPTFVEVWLDTTNGVVRKTSDDSQLILVTDVDIPMNEDITIPAGSYPVYVSQTDESTTFYIMVNDERISISGMFSYLSPFEPSVIPPGDYPVEIYSLDKNIIFDHFACALSNSDFVNYTLSKNIKTIKAYSFSGNWQRYLSEIWYEGTMDEFNAIEKEAKWNYYTSKYKSVRTVHCSDGDLSV